MVRGVDLQHPVHPLERNQDAAETGNRGTGQAGSRATCGDGGPRLARGLDHGRHLGGGARPDHERGLPGHRTQRLVMAVIRWRSARGQDLVRAYRPGQQYPDVSHQALPIVHTERQAGRGTEANADSVNHLGMARRSASGPCTSTAPERRAPRQSRSPRQTSTIRRRLAVTVTATG